MISNIFEQLKGDVRSYFMARRQKRNYRRGEAIYRMGESANGLYVIEKGLVGLVFHSPKGTDHLLRLFRGGQFFGHRSYFAQEPHHATSIALEPTELSYISHDDFEEVLKLQPSLIREILVAMAKELRRAELHRVTVTEQDVLARTAQAILYMKEIDSAHRWTRSEIASFCASTTPTIVRALAQLENQGLIRQEGREIQVLDRDGLLRFETEAS